jgi:hypothetical protein
LLNTVNTVKKVKQVLGENLLKRSLLNIVVDKKVFLWHQMANKLQRYFPKGVSFCHWLSFSFKDWVVEMWVLLIIYSLSSTEPTEQRADTKLYNVVYRVRSPTFIWAPCAQLTHWLIPHKPKDLEVHVFSRGAWQ